MAEWTDRVVVGFAGICVAAAVIGLGASALPVSAQDGSGAAPDPAADEAADAEATMLAAGDAEAGKTVFKKCRPCHEIGPDAKIKVGPVLTGVIGRPAGSYEGYEYGKDMMVAAGMGLVWTPELLFEYLADPRAFLRSYTANPKAKTKMVLKLKDDEDRRNVIAYLRTFE